jgi:hypothetical protein
MDLYVMMTMMLYLLHFLFVVRGYFMNDSIHCLCLSLNYPLLELSRMGDNNPPPPNYMAAMRQQFELNRQFMEGIMNQFPRPNANQQPASIMLQDFVRLNPAIFRNTVNPWMLMIGSVTSSMKWSQLPLPLTAMSPLRHIF